MFNSKPSSFIVSPNGCFFRCRVPVSISKLEALGCDVYPTYKDLLVAQVAEGFNAQWSEELLDMIEDVDQFKYSSCLIDIDENKIIFSYNEVDGREDVNRFDCVEEYIARFEP